MRGQYVMIGESSEDTKHAGMMTENDRRDAR